MDLWRDVNANATPILVSGSLDSDDNGDEEVLEDGDSTEDLESPLNALNDNEDPCGSGDDAEDAFDHDDLIKNTQSFDHTVKGSIKQMEGYARVNVLRGLDFNMQENVVYKLVKLPTGTCHLTFDMTFKGDILNGRWIRVLYLSEINLKLF